MSLPDNDRVRRLPISTPSGTFEVWTRQVGDAPAVKLLLLHGGPGASSECFECFDDVLPAGGVELHHYDQLGSWRSDQPDPSVVCDVDRFVDEVEQVRVALGLDAGSFFLLGHSWGGILAIEYALRHGQHLKGLVISNMMSSIPAYNRFAHNVLMPTMDPAVLAEIQRLEADGRTTDPRYEELLMEHHYAHHVLRLPVADWPDAVVRTFAHLNQDVYVPMQGPSELGASGQLLTWDRTGDLHRIEVPTLVISAEHDTMDPAYLREMAGLLPRGELLHCPDGSHLAMWDDQQAYLDGLLAFLTSHA